MRNAQFTVSLSPISSFPFPLLLSTPAARLTLYPEIGKNRPPLPPSSHHTHTHIQPIPLRGSCLLRSGDDCGMVSLPACANSRQSERFCESLPASDVHKYSASTDRTRSNHHTHQQPLIQDHVCALCTDNMEYIYVYKLVRGNMCVTWYGFVCLCLRKKRTVGLATKSGLLGRSVKKMPSENRCVQERGRPSKVPGKSRVKLCARAQKQQKHVLCRRDDKTCVWGVSTFACMCIQCTCVCCRRRRHYGDADIFGVDGYAGPGIFTYRMYKSGMLDSGG